MTSTQIINPSSSSLVNLESLKSLPKTQIIKLLKQNQSTLTHDQLQTLFQQFKQNHFISTLIQILLIKSQISSSQYSVALSSTSTLISSLKSIDDKQSLIKCFLLECEVYYKLKNGNKARSSLTNAKSNANVVYVGGDVQGEVDFWSGCLCLFDGDYKTAFSYFLESFQGKQELVKNLDKKDKVESGVNSGVKGVESGVKGVNNELLKIYKYLVLCKIMTSSSNLPEFKIDSVDEDKELEILLQIHKNKKIIDLSQIKDEILFFHLKKLQEIYYEDEIKKIILPYSKCELEFIGQKLGFNDVLTIEQLLSRMILDGKVKGCLDQFKGKVVFVSSEDDFREEDGLGLYQTGLEMMEEFGVLVDELFVKCK